MLKTKLSTSNQIITKISIKTPRTPILYELHEIHKCFEKLPPPLQLHLNKSMRICWFLLKIPSKDLNIIYWDTSDFLLKLKSLSTVPSTSILVTMDLTSLYTDIDHKEGADACYKKIENTQK